MEDGDKKPLFLKKNPVKIEADLTQVVLKDIPLDVRKKEAKQPLFLLRYE